jgi:amino acid transporter
MSLRDRLFGKPRDLRDPNLFHHVSLIAFFAWVGLGADGLSSSSYGPEQAFKHLAGHTYLAVFLALATAITVFVISYAYSRVIEHFPHGGGGYLVATKLLGERAGLVSGCALLVDYILTIAISVAVGVNSLFALLPASLQSSRFATQLVIVFLLIILNLRGVKESVKVLTPIFLVFLVTHAVLIGGTVGPHIGRISTVGHEVRTGLAHDLSKMGVFALLMLFAKAYSLGGGTYTGIEAVSNGLTIMREPRVETGKRTMNYMAISLAITAGGIILAYLLFGVNASPFDARDPSYEPMNAILAKQFAGSWHLGGLAIGKGFIWLTLLSEGALLFVAAQAGFIGGPQTMANMALDSWVPHQFSALSERLTMRNGVMLMGGLAMAVLLYTRGDVDTLAVMYSINVFLTFSLTQLGMVRFWLAHRKKDPAWSRHIWIHLLGFVMCAVILVITILEKFAEGGWMTLVATTAAVALCMMVRRHYRHVGRKVAQLNDELAPITMTHDVSDPGIAPAPEELDPSKPTAVLLAGGYSGLGVHTLLQIERLFPGQFRQVVFVSAGVIDSGTFKGAEEIQALEKSLRGQLAKYVQFARNKLGWAADADVIIGTEAVAEIERLCREVYLRFPRAMFFAGKLIFREPTWWQRLLHNETAHAVQRRLEFDGLPMVILPVRVLK